MRMTPGRSQRPRRGARRGYVLLETTMAVMVLLAAMALAVRLTYLVGQEQRSADRRLWATQVVTNLADRLSSEPLDRVTPERVQALAALQRAQGVLPAAEWSSQVHELRVDGIAAKRVQLRLRWKTSKGDWDAPARLSIWLFAPGPGQNQEKRS